ncbi:MAG: ribosome assembly factor SBDS [Nanoarchaeota archaeon]|jgi:ribosome maturation protein SDO1|nr:ribosome assembly factor SBDS [Nanoarchaeota archaeon]
MAADQEHGKFDVGVGNTIARIRKGATLFEIVVNMDDALKVKKGESDYLLVEGDNIFTEVKKGNRASNAELETAFGTSNVDEVGKIIVKTGDIETDQEHRGAEQEQKVKQVVEFLATNAIDPQSGRPITAERLRSSLHEAHVNIKNTPIESQMHDILAALSTVMPIKIETRKIKVTVPAIQTGKAYGVLSQYKERENWLADGSLEAVLNIPAGILIDFYDKLNSVTHGSASTEELKE